VLPIIEEYHKLSQDQSYCDCDYHLILTSSTPTIRQDEMHKLIEMGITSVKLYVTCDPMKLGDYDLLFVMKSDHWLYDHGMLICIAQFYLPCIK